MEFKKFNSGMEMYEYVHAGNDLYSKSLGTYVFDYNDAGALCNYCLSPEDFAEVIKASEEHDGEYWAAFLGWYGSAVLDETKYDDDEHRYTSDWELKKLYLAPSLEFCEEVFNTEDWLDTSDVTVEYVMAE